MAEVANKVKFDGTEKFERKAHITMYNANIVSCDENGIVYGDKPEWVPLGKDNDELTRTLNNETEAKKNVLGETSISHKSGAQTTEIDPIAIKGDDVLSYVLYLMFKYNLTGDKAKLKFMEVTLADKDDAGNYGAFTEEAIVDLKSWGGDTSQINGPVTLNWLGNKEHGKYNIKTNSFTGNTTTPVE